MRLREPLHIVNMKPSQNYQGPRLFLLHHIQNHSIQEIARRVAKSEDAVKSHLYRVRKVLLAR